MKNSLAGAPGVGGLLMNLATVIRWRLSRDLVLQFYLLVQVFEVTLQSANTPQVYEKYGS